MMTNPEYRSQPFQVKTRLPDDVDNSSPSPLATFLGLFSIGLGLAEVACPRDTAATTGVRYPELLRGYGVREMIAGAGILFTKRPAFWLWSRVAGDVMDLSTIAAAYGDADENDRKRLFASAVAVVGVTALDLLCATEHSREEMSR